MRGRKPLPSNVVRLRGNPGKRRLNDAEPTPAPGVPSCPSCLGEEARKEWKRLARELDDLGLLTRIHRGMLAAYCQAHALWVEAVSSIERYPQCSGRRHAWRLLPTHRPPDLRLDQERRG